MTTAPKTPVKIANRGLALRMGQVSCHPAPQAAARGHPGADLRSKYSRTASGTAVHVGVVAVDRNVLPLGTKVYVVSNDGMYNYGFAIAEDTGVRGNSIDLYMDTSSECIQFGVRNCTVYILD